MKTVQSDTPYTVEHISKMLQMDENAINQYCKKLPVSPKRDLRTGNAVFSSRDYNMLKKARELHTAGESLTTISKKLGTQNPLTHRVASKNDIAVVLDSVKKGKEEVLSSLTQLIEDKLEGMDEVVVELIKCKSENENLKQKVKSLREENNLLKDEIIKYKPVKFGFYRRTD